jgi:hypothetical protein
VLARQKVVDAVRSSTRERQVSTAFELTEPVIVFDEEIAAILACLILKGDNA